MPASPRLTIEHTAIRKSINSPRVRLHTKINRLLPDDQLTVLRPKSKVIRSLLHSYELMKIGILGSGDVGRRLADGFIELGNSVKIGSRNPHQEKITEWMAKHDKSKVSSGTFAEAASFGELDLIATLWAGTADAIKMADPKNFAGKVVIDVTNPLDFSKGMPTLAIGHTDSAGETVQRMLSDSKVVKAFNTVGNPHFIHPDFPCGPPTMFICGNDDQAKKTVIDNILTKFGWETIDIGGIEGARLLEPLAFLWITHYIRTSNGNHAFKLLRK